MLRRIHKTGGEREFTRPFRASPCGRLRRANRQAGLSNPGVLTPSRASAKLTARNHHYTSKLAERGGSSQPDPKSLILLAERKPGCVLFCVPPL